MNLIQRIHVQGQAHTHDESEAHSHGAPFWVRHYDRVVNLITLGRTKTIHPKLDAVKAIEIVNYYQRHHEAAYCSHRKRRLARLHETEISL